MKFVDDYNKEVTWYNKNYYFLGTVIFVGLIFLMEYGIKDQVIEFMTKYAYLSTILVPVLFSNMINLVVSAACIGLVSLFLEKYWGTIRYLVTMILTLVGVAYIVPTLLLTHIVLNPVSGLEVSGLQFSTLVYAVFALALVEIVFHPKKHLLDKLHSLPAYGVIILIGAIMCVLLPAAVVENDFAAYFKEVKFTVFEPLTKNAYNWFSAMVGGGIGIVSTVSALVSGGSGFGGYSSGGGGSKKRAKDDTGLTFADIMEKEKKEAEAQANPEPAPAPIQETTNNYSAPTPSTPLGGYASGYIGTPTATPPTQNTGVSSIFGASSTTDNKDRVVVGETVKQYSDYNQYINEKMKNLNNKAGGNK